MATVRDIDRGWTSFRRLIADAGRRELVVGIADSKTASYALVVELGTRDGTIPPRPVFRSTIDSNADEYARLLTAYVAQQVQRQGSTIDPALTRLGMRVRNDLIKGMRSWADPPNAPSTIARKGVNNPWVDTGHAQRSIMFEIRDRGADS